MEKYTVSFIMPVYNVAEFIPRCIESIISQKIEDKEIILVNDGSTDNSLEVCRRYEQNYKFIRVISIENSGVSVARNIGIKNAKGKYVCFIDADDFYIAEFAKEFYEICEREQLDIIRGIYCSYIEETDFFNHINLKELTYYNKVLSGKEFLKKSIDENANEVVPWLGFFKREFLQVNKLWFPEGIAFEEDQLFFLKAILAKNCTIMQKELEFYAYRVRSGSASKSPSVKKAYNVIWIVDQELKHIQRTKLDKETTDYAKRYTSASFYQLTSIYGRVDRSKRKEIRNICTTKIKRECVKHAANKHQKSKIFLFVYFPWIVDLVYDLRRYRLINRR